MFDSLYDSFAESMTRKQWKNLGLKRRSGVNTPLFSLYSDQSTGIGEMPDLKLLIDWCAATGQSIIQLLPLNDVGFQFCPYDAQSTFALDPMYLSPENLTGVDISPWQKDISALKEKFPCGGRQRVDYGIKKAKLDLFLRIYETQKNIHSDAFTAFREKHVYWLKDYGFYRVLKKRYDEVSWNDWPEPYRAHDEQALADLFLEKKKEYFFYVWLQWQLFEQLKSVKEYGVQKGVYLMGDLPFLVSRDSADVWAHQNYFKLDRESGAPPDAYIADGQRWGMPPYDWPVIEKDGFAYLRQKVALADHFYSLFRIDHVVGLFRLWTIASSEPFESAGRNGVFDPADENLWEDHGRKLLKVMAESSSMLPCAEDLGTVPPCSYKVLGEMSVPGMEIQRWARDWDGTGEFLNPDSYRLCSVAMISTHDMPHFLGWWLGEVGFVDKGYWENFCSSHNLSSEDLAPKLFNCLEGRLTWKWAELTREKIAEIIGNSKVAEELLEGYDHSREEREKFLRFLELDSAVETEEIIYRALLQASKTSSVFSIQFIQDWLALAGFYRDQPYQSRMNAPGTVGDENWSLLMPLSLNQMLQLDVNQKILEINRQGERL